MTVADYIKKLQELPQDAMVFKTGDDDEWATASGPGLSKDHIIDGVACYCSGARFLCSICKEGYPIVDVVRLT